MTKGNRASPSDPSQELISKLIRAGYLQHALRHDADAITRAIAQLREDLRGGGEDNGGPKTAVRFHPDRDDGGPSPIGVLSAD
jgi:hypothetical protein